MIGNQNMMMSCQIYSIIKESVKMDNKDIDVKELNIRLKCLENEIVDKMIINMDKALQDADVNLKESVAYGE